MALVLAGCGPASVAPPGPGVGTRVDGRIPGWVLDLPLRDQQGRTRHLADFHDQVLVVSDAMTLCQETCPLDTAEVVRTARSLDSRGQGKHVQFLSITVDPQRDTVHRLAAYRRLYPHPPANWSLLTGDPGAIHRLWKWFGVYWHKVPDGKPAPRDWMTGRALTYDVTHSDEVFFLHHGRERFVLEGPPHVAKGSDIPARIYDFMNAEGHHNTRHATPAAWTSDQAAHVVRWLLGQ
jgi:protein SCO1/2